MIRRVAPIVAALGLAACKPPPEAPEAFGQNCPYLFEHQWDEDQTALLDGLDSLKAWLDEEYDEDEMKDGYIVDPLTEAAMDALDEVDRTAEDMVGLALVTQSLHTVDENVYPLVAVDQDVIFPASFSDYERTYLSGPECFVDRTCDRMEATEVMTSTFAGGIVHTTAHSYNQYVWADLDGEWAMVHRNWQQIPPEVNLGWLEVDEQAYLNVFVPREGGCWRLQAQWTVYDPNNDVPEDTAKAMIVNWFQSSHDDLEKYLDEQAEE